MVYKSSISSAGGGGGGVSSLNSLTGALSLTSTGATISITPSGTNINLESLSGGAGTVTTTGSPLIGNLTQFSGPTSITNVNLSGDVTTGGSAATTVAKIQGTVVSGTTGTGNVVFSNSPTLITPALGTPASGVATNLTGTATGLTAGTATALATGRTISITGDLAYTSPSFDGSTNVTAAGTLATVNANIGTFQGITVNAKGLVTAASNQGYITGNQTITLSGDITGSGTTAITGTLATVNTNTGSFGSSTSIPNFTVNGKGLITAAGGNVVIAPAGTLSGTTLNSTVVTSSLTSVGAQAQALNMNTHLINNVVDPASAQDAATKNYVDMAVAAIQSKNDCQAATTTVLAAATYNNGSSGVGATLTLTVAAVLVLDGYTPALNDRLLIKNQASALQNGIYSLTTVGTLGVTQAVLTRTLDFDQPADGINGALVYVLNGTTNANTLWSCTTSGTITFGTTNINWSQFLGATYTADGTTLQLTGTTFSIKLSNPNTWSGKQTYSAGQYVSGGAIEEAVFSNGNSGTSLALNLDNGNLQSVTITGAVAITQTTPTHPGKYTLIVTQDGTGHVYSLSGVKFPGGTAPTYSTAASKVDVISLIYDGTNWYGMGGIAFS